jgi:predicted dehydrogenase
MSKRVRVGVIGAGRMADHVHLKSLGEIAEVDVVGICDIIPDKAVALAQKYKISRTFRNPQDLITRSQLDATIVLVEPASLFHVVRQCLEAGLPTFMEKPPGITMFQADSLSRLAEQAKMLLQVGFNRRYIPLVREVLAFVKQRAAINQVDGQFVKSGRGDFDNGSVSAFTADTIHCVDLILHIAGGIPVDAATISHSTNATVDNIWNSVFRFDNGIVGTIRANYETGSRVHSFEIYGRGISAFINLGFGAADCRAKVLCGGKSGYSLAATGSENTTVFEFDGASAAGSAEFHRLYGYYAELSDFITCVRTGAAPLCDIHEARKSMAMVEFLLSRAI